MKTYDELDECKPPGPPIEEDNKPAIGSKVADGQTVVRVKPVCLMDNVYIDIMTRRIETLAPNLVIVRHKSRPFVGWLAEVSGS